MLATCTYAQRSIASVRASDGIIAWMLMMHDGIDGPKRIHSKAFQPSMYHTSQHGRVFYELVEF